MTRAQRRHTLRSRQGVVLLVVVTLLTLFAVVGITFVIYSQAEAGSMRGARESETLQRPDADPEALLAFFLNQLVYDTNNNVSAMRGHSLARTMYGSNWKGTSNATTAFNGSGRLHTAAPDDYSNVDYTNYGNAGDPRDPDKYGSPNPGYTYPDFNNMFLAAVRASDGAVLIPSYSRTNPQNGQPAISLRPNAAYHTQFPPLEDGYADVKNRPDGPGFLYDPANNKLAPNDSIWIDAGFPVIRMPDGRKVKPLFAPLIQDLDSLVNVNVHGNVMSDISRNQHWCISHQGWSPGEVSLDRVIQGPNWEVQAIFNGNNGIKGRYNNQGPATLCDAVCPGGTFYSGSDIDCWLNTEQNCIVVPPKGTGVSFPWYNEAYSSSWWQGMDKSVSPLAYNYFDPSQNWYLNSGANGTGGLQTTQYRSFSPAHLEALYRYGDTGSPALRSDLFLLCPQSFGDPNTGAKTRRLVTTLSMDLARPGVMPSMSALPAAGTLQLPSGLQLGQAYAQRQPLSYPAPGSLPGNGSGEFSSTYYAMADAVNNVLIRNRINLNRGLQDFPLLDNNTLQFSSPPSNAPATYALGMQSRQQLAKEIFFVLCAVTGASFDTKNNAATTAPGTPEYDACRYLAQLAANIVSFVDFPNVNRPPAPCDVMVMFNWNPAQTASVQNGWVFGTVLPRLVVNEAYIEIANTQADQKNPPKMASTYDINAWVELHNPFPNDGGNGQVNNWQFTPTPYTGTAQLYYTNANYAGYRLIVAQTIGDGGGPDNSTIMTKNDNVLGNPANIQTVVDQYTPDTPTTNQTTVLNGAALNQVQTLNLNRGNNVQTQITNSAMGNNQGFYVLGPKTPLPGTDKMANFFATLPVKEQPQQQNDTLLNSNKNSSMHYTFTPANAQMTDFTPLNHAVVLQRLACPYMAPNFNPQDPNFNPYVTVDFMLKVPINDAVTVDGQGAHNSTPVTQRNSYGRNQPYAADNTQQFKQLANYDATQLNKAQPPPAAPMSQQTPQNTFFCMNVQGQNAQGQPFPAFPYDWMFWANRLLISPMELLHVSGYKPAQLTQMFMTGGTDPNTGVPLKKFTHLAPWYGGDTPIYRALEFFEGGMRPQWSPLGGRFSGRININNVWDIETFRALCDQQDANYFTAACVDNTFNRMIQSRSPKKGPAPGDRPFLPMAGPFIQAGQQYPNGCGVDDTFLRIDPQAPANNPKKRLFEVNPDQAVNPPEMRKDPVTGVTVDQLYLKNELMFKIFGNMTTRSNVFAVWLTVGFFKVVDDSNANLPPKLGKEIGKAEGRQVRHRMFAILDRTNLTIDPNNQGQAGPRPWTLNSLKAVTTSDTQITVPAQANNAYEDSTWTVKAGDKLVVDTGSSQETVTVQAVAPGAAGLQITLTAPFTQAHSAGFCVSNAVFGNPGPQQYFDPRNPKYNGIVRYFSIIQ